MPDQQPTKRKLVVTSCRQKATGKSQKGEWTLYELGVTAEDGTPIDEQFNSFQDLTEQIGKLEEYEVTRRDDQRYGTTYTLKRQQGRLGPRVEKLEKEVKELRERLERLESEGTPATASVGAGEEDIPF